MKGVNNRALLLILSAWLQLTRAAERLRGRAPQDTNRQLATTAVGQIVAFELIDVSTGQKVATVTDHAVISLSDLGLDIEEEPNLNLKAVTDDGDTSTVVGSVQFDFDDTANFRTENVAPYALCGDRSGVYLQCKTKSLGLGSHSITATPHQGRGASGVVGVPFTVEFTVVATMPISISGFKLIHTPTNDEVMDLYDGTVVDVATLGYSEASFNVKAQDEGDLVKSVQFAENGRKENVKPFAFCGDKSGDYLTCRSLTVNATHTVTVTPYSGPEQTGTAMPVASVTFSIIDSTTETTGPEGAWIEITDSAPIQARHEACFVMVGRKAYLVGGRGNKRTDVYNSVSRTWSESAKPPIAIHHMQCVEAQGKLWVMAAWTGGFPRERTVDHVYAYDPVEDSWETKTAIPESRRRGAAAVVVSDDGKKIYVANGNKGGHEKAGDNVDAVSLGYLDVYDIATDSWTALSDSAPHPRDHTCAAMIDGRLCVAGGRNGGLENWPSVAETDCYNFDTEEWETEASIPQARAGSSCGTTCDGKLMVAGGEGDGVAWSNVDIFDGKTWTSIADLNVGRHGSGLAVDCVCNQIHIASGSAAQGGKPEIQSVETWFPGGVDEPCSP